jgi:hypothetical protein
MGISVQPPVIRRLREQTQSLAGTPLPARTVLSFGLETIDARLSGGGGGSRGDAQSSPVATTPPSTAPRPQISQLGLQFVYI